MEKRRAFPRKIDRFNVPRALGFRIPYRGIGIENISRTHSTFVDHPINKSLNIEPDLRARGLSIGVGNQITNQTFRALARELTSVSPR